MAMSRTMQKRAGTPKDILEELENAQTEEDEYHKYLLRIPMVIWEEIKKTAKRWKKSNVFVIVEFLAIGFLVEEVTRRPGSSLVLREEGKETILDWRWKQNQRYITRS